jgi:hypothetical protein
MDEQAIAKILEPKGAGLFQQLVKKVQPLLKNGAAMGALDFPLKAGEERKFKLPCEGKVSYVVAAVNGEGAPLYLAVYDSDGRKVASDENRPPDPTVDFSLEKDGDCTLVVANRSKKDTNVILAVLKK